MPYVSQLEAPFKLAANNSELMIPILVLKGGQQQCPSIGFNVFPHLRNNKAKTFIKAVSVRQTCKK